MWYVWVGGSGGSRVWEGPCAAGVLAILQLHKRVPFYIVHSQFFSFILVSFSLFESESRSVVSNSLRPHELYSPQNSPGQNTVEGNLSLLQGIFSTQGLNPGLPQCRRMLYRLSHKGSPRILDWVAYPFSSRSSQSRNWTGVSCIAGGFFDLPTIPLKLFSISSIRLCGFLIICVFVGVLCLVTHLINFLQKLFLCICNLANCLA